VVGHLEILRKVLKDPTFDMPRDEKPTAYNFELPFKVYFPERLEWTIGGPIGMSKVVH